MSALAMCLSGLPASFTWIVKESGDIRISSWVTGTLVRRYPGASTATRDSRGRSGNVNVPLDGSAVTERPPCVILAGPAVPMGSLVKSSRTWPRMSTPFSQPPTRVVRTMRRIGKREASRYGRKLRVNDARLPNTDVPVEPQLLWSEEPATIAIGFMQVG
jgi:hypothetical protein